jgi:hypothetical protein
MRCEREIERENFEKKKEKTGEINNKKNMGRKFWER